jgi:hypothetical protein
LNKRIIITFILLEREYLDKINWPLIQNLDIHLQDTLRTSIHVRALPIRVHDVDAVPSNRFYRWEAIRFSSERIEFEGDIIFFLAAVV